MPTISADGMSLLTEHILHCRAPLPPADLHVLMQPWPVYGDPFPEHCYLYRLACPLPLNHYHMYMHTSNPLPSIKSLPVTKPWAPCQDTPPSPTSLPSLHAAWLKVRMCTMHIHCVPLGRCLVSHVRREQLGAVAKKSNGQEKQLRT